MAGYFNEALLARLRKLRDGNPEWNPLQPTKWLNDTLHALNEVIPVFRSADVTTTEAVAINMNKSRVSMMLEPGRTHAWIMAQGGIGNVAPRLFESVLDIYKSSSDPTGMVGAGHLLAVLRGEVKPDKNDYVQHMFLAIANDLARSDPTMARNFLNLASDEYTRRQRPAIMASAPTQEGHGLGDRFLPTGASVRLPG